MDIFLQGRETFEQTVNVHYNNVNVWLYLRNGSKERIMKKYVCDVCGYIYDPALGDPDNGIKAGTAFEEIPDDWVCPECGASKDEFSVME